MADRAPSTLSLPAPTLAALTRRGYNTTQDLSATNPAQLLQDLNLPLASSQAIFSATAGDRAGSVLPMTQSAASMAGTTKRYPTSCAALDALLDGGLRRGHILELSGPPGCGKEKIAALAARSFLREDQEVLFVDMQNMVPPAALRDLLVARTDPDPAHAGAGDGIDNVCDRVRHLAPHTALELAVLIRTLPAYLAAHPATALVVLNSLAFPLQAYTKPSDLDGFMDPFKQTLARLCATTGLTVVITSTLRVKMRGPDMGDNNTTLDPVFEQKHLPSGRTHRVIVVPRTRSSGVMRLLSAPTHVHTTQHTTVREAAYTTIDGVPQ